MALAIVRFYNSIASGLNYLKKKTKTKTENLFSKLLAWNMSRYLLKACNFSIQSSFIEKLVTGYV